LSSTEVGKAAHIRFADLIEAQASPISSKQGAYLKRVSFGGWAGLNDLSFDVKAFDDVSSGINERLDPKKQPDERAAFRVKSAQVRPLVCIAVVAGESEVSAVVSSAMLASDDVLNVIGKERPPHLAAGNSIRSDNRPVRGQLPDRSSIRRHDLQPRADELSLAE
jgi:hypothetical protein